MRSFVAVALVMLATTAVNAQRSGWYVVSVEKLHSVWTQSCQPLSRTSATAAAASKYSVARIPSFCIDPRCWI
jgi:hypothetical protein